ncbi:MAG: hypothetical protein NTW21_10060 [Verrucomicrobia bacterium]|nr:hypothetical protein [Verrucomicrobiota bacterium]
MVFSTGFERKFGWLAFPGFLRYFALMHVLVYLLKLVRPEIGSVLMFDREHILAGEVWRVLTFLFASSWFEHTPLGMILMFFTVMIAFMISDALEGAWGEFKTSMYYYCGIIGLIAANFLKPGFDGMFVYEAAFFAFATLFPRVEFRLMFILPVRVSFLAMLGAMRLLWPTFKTPLWLLFLVLIFANYLLWAGLPALRGKAREVAAGKRRGLFKAAKATVENAFHRCEICGKTEVSDPHGDFRVGRDGKEYCEDHLGGH